MKFKNYINESNIGNIDKIIETIRDDCGPYLSKLNKDYKKNEYFVSGRQRVRDFLEKNVRDDREPRNTQKWMHKLFDEMFKKYYGIKYRSNSIFCYSYPYKYIKIKDIEFMYGSGYMVFPIGKYEIIYNNNFPDLYLYMDDYIKDNYNKSLIHHPEKYPKEIEEIKNFIEGMMRSYSIWKSEKIYVPGNNPECMCNTKKVYLVNVINYLNRNNKLDYFLEGILK